MTTINPTYKILSTATTLLLFMLILLVSSCEEPFDPGISVDRDEIVVEAYIEWSEGGGIPTFAVISRSFPFTGLIDADFASDVFIRDAMVSVSKGDEMVELTKVCLEDIPEDFRDEVISSLGIDSVLVNICLYVDVNGEIEAFPGEQYELEVIVDDARVTSTVVIPRPVPLDSLWATAVPDPDADTLAQLRLSLSDPPGPDFYRYFTSVNGGPFIPPVASVTDDALFDGQSFEVNILKAEPRGTDFDPETFGFFSRGDEVILKWCTIERAQFRFWETLEYNRNNQGPFTNYTLVESNIEGDDGLGVFGAQSCFYYEITIPEEL